MLVCGGRAFTDQADLFSVLDSILAEMPIALVIHGAARGADTMGGDWAESRGLPVQVFYADWEHLGRAGHGATKGE